LATVILIVGLLVPTAARADFGIAPGSFVADSYDATGDVESQAGAHPFRATTRFDLSHTADGKWLAGRAKNVHLELPPGFVGSPETTAKCPRWIFSRLGTAGDGSAGEFISPCPTDSQIGTAIVRFFANGRTSTTQSAVYNLEPAYGHTAQIGMLVQQFVPVILDATVDTAGDYGIVVDASKISEGKEFGGVTVDLWGVPNDPTHDPLRVCGYGSISPVSETCSAEAPAKPFLTNPTSCTGPLRSTLTADSWERPEVGEASYESAGLVGCDRLPFEPAFTLRPDSRAADSPTGVAVDLALPQDVSREGLATATMKKAVVTLPRGMSVNPSSASGLGGCSSAQIALHSNAPVTCPDSSKIGSVSIETPLLGDPLNGSVYLARQGDNEFGSLLGLYLVVADPARGLLIKLAGKVEPDPGSGQLVATFDNNPQLPFSHLHLQFKTGSRAPLVTPANCGTYTTKAELTPWSGTAPVVSTSSFEIDSGPNGGPCPDGTFAPRFSAGTSNPLGGLYSPLRISFSREDGTQLLKAISTTLPPGLTGKLAGIPYCPESGLAGISGAEGTAAAQIGSPACPAASQVGTVTVGAGAGPSPFYLDTGRAYLAGPYKGAPLSMAIVTPVLAGPFDLGTIVVRTALRVDPTTAQITAVSDTLPTILHGIPVDLRDIRVDVNRDQFTLNPTSCDPMEVKGTIGSAEGKSANVSDRFQVASCERLAFKPNLKLSVKGATHRNAHPAFKAVLTMPKADGANIQKAQVTLPKTELLENAHIRTICTRVQYAAGAGGGSQCPPASIYGKAKAWSPLLDKPLEGPVYLRSSSHQLPDLVASLDGQIHIDLVGRIDAVNARIRNTFEGVPDAPVSRFVLEMQGGRKGLLANNTELCRTTPRAAVKFDAQNGKLADSNPVMKADCGKGRRGKRK
jgi:hypothetical protein